MAEKGIANMSLKLLASLTLGLILTFVPFVTSAKGAKKTKTRDVQEVNFGEMNLKGTIRNPDGAYLVQKKGIKFMPLHDIQKDMDKRIRETSLYIE
ncbi:hypothetical protein [Pseudobdellovibrio sp. HCB154]|uniref:hypothetical protein n=1 Tax=Pseudobdellovibrio sp. HCB154 TaxID=3386277 RepID=UPI00391758E1